MKSVTFPRKAASLLLTLNAMSNSSRVSQGTITGIYGMLRLIEMENIRDPLFPLCATKQADPGHCGCNFLILQSLSNRLFLMVFLSFD